MRRPRFSSTPIHQAVQKVQSWIWLAPLAAFLLTFSALWLYSRNLPLLAHHPEYQLDTLQLTIALAYSFIGAFIILRKPGNSIGLIFCLIGFFSALYLFSTQYAVYSYMTLKTNLPLAPLMSWLQSSIWLFPFTLFVLLIYLYPDGRVLSPRWRWAAWATFATIPLLLLVAFIYQWPYRGPLLMLPAEEVPPPMSESVQMMRMLGFPLIFSLIFFLLPFSVSSLFLRFRQAGNIERQQIKWFLYAGAIFGVILITTFLFLFTRPDLPQVGNTMWNVLLPIAAIELPLAVAFAIFRYHLFDIDLIIRRTLVYSTLTIVLAVIYFLTVIGLQAILRSLTGQNSQVAIVLSTLVIVALFSPLHRGIQHNIDRRFFRGRYNVNQVLAGLSSISRSEVDIDRLASALLSTVDETIHPESLSLWIRKQ